MLRTKWVETCPEMSDSKAGALESQGVLFMCWWCSFVVDLSWKGHAEDPPSKSGTIDSTLGHTHPFSLLRSFGILNLSTEDFINHHHCSLQIVKIEPGPEHSPQSTPESLPPWHPSPLVTTLAVLNPCYWDSAFIPPQTHHTKYLINDHV